MYPDSGFREIIIGNLIEIRSGDTRVSTIRGSVEVYSQSGGRFGNNTQTSQDDFGDVH